MFDLIISGGTVVDGSGGKSRRADVAINGDKIVGVGDYSNKASTRTVDASGCLVTPGWVDVHTHYPEALYDLPAGGKRLVQQVDGYRYTFKSGVETFIDGEHTGALPGRLVRGGQGSARL